jgi:dienelactone hydrolase
MSRRHLTLLLATGLLAGSGAVAMADVEPPVLHVQQKRGTAVTTELPSVTPTPKTVDGRTDDWVGEAPGFSGLSSYSAGELVHADYLFDAFGADDGDDAERVGRNDALEERHPGFYRLEPTYQYDAAGQLGAPTGPLGVKGEPVYGDARDTDGRGHVAAADLREVRVAADADTVHLLVRTTTMTADRSAGVVVLADTVDGSPAYDVPFGSGLRTSSGDVALFLSQDGGVAIDLATKQRATLTVAASSADHDNALEAAIPRELLEQAAKALPEQANGKAKGHDKRGLRLALAAGVADGPERLVDLKSDRADVGNLANIAFRPAEPVRIRFDKRQAFALSKATIDPFFTEIDLAGLTTGRTEAFRPGPGYHERQFRSTSAISTEGDVDGIWQPYGVYVPTSYDGTKKTRTTYWMHWRGGDTHDAAVVSPRTMRDFGEDVGGLVIAPRGRGTATWYVGRAQLDFRQVWDDALKTFSIDEDRVYVTGHSMGGWASYLLSILYPDRFAAALPYAGVPTQGLWAGCELDPCFQGTNGGNAKDQWTNPLLENLRNVPIAISHGALDELVPVSGVTRQAEKLAKLGYQYRYYLFPTYEHYSHPIFDEWVEGARYASQFKRDKNPSRVTYMRSMPFENIVEKGNSGSNELNTGEQFDFDSAYWMSGLEAVDPERGVAKVDAVSLAKPKPPVLTAPEAGGPASVGQFGPYAMQGLRWLDNGSAPAAANGFTATLSGAKAVGFDLARMGISTTVPVTGSVTTEKPLTLSLAGAWASLPAVTGATSASLTDGVLTLELPAGTTNLKVG